MQEPVVCVGLRERERELESENAIGKKLESSERERETDF